MNQRKLWVLAAILIIICGACVITCCSSEDDNPVVSPTDDSSKPLPDHFDMKHAYAAAKAYAGMTLAEFDAFVKAYAAQPANGFSGMTYGGVYS